MSRCSANRVHSWEGLWVALALGLGALVGSGCAPEKLHMEHREPAPDASDVSVHAPIQARFDAPLAPESLSEERVHLRTSEGDELAKSLQLSEDRQVLTVVPAAPLQTFQGYQLTFDPGLKSADGGELDTASASWAWFVPEWLPLGEPLWTADRQFVLTLSITVDSEGAPVVVGCEQGSEPSASRPFARRWDGTAWQALGSESLPTDTFCSSELLLAPGPGRQLWLRGGRLQTRLAAFDGATWREAWISDPYVHALPFLSVGPSNQPVSFLEGSVRRFREGQWEDLGMPTTPAGKGGAIGLLYSALMLDEQERPLLAQTTYPTAELRGGSIRLSRWDQGAWDILGELPAPLGSFSPDSSYGFSMIGMEADALGQPVLAWYRQQSLCAGRGNCIEYSESRFARWKDGTWEEAAPQRVGVGGNLTVEPSGALLIQQGRALWRLSGGAWAQIGSFDRMPASAPFIELAQAVSPEGVPYAVYAEQTDGGSVVRVALLNR